MNKYNIIYADPPWQYTSKSVAPSKEVTNHYPTMCISDILKLPIAEIADNNCFSFLWVTFPNLQEGLDVIKAWGFEYKTVAFNWVKMNKKSDSWFWGMGSYTRANSEVCLLGKKGKPAVASHSVHSVLSERVERHSKKPDIVRNKIVELCGDLPRAELFARQATSGWDVWGNEVACDIEMGDMT